MVSGKKLILLVEGRGAGDDSLAPALAKKWQLGIAHTGAEALAFSDSSYPDIVVFDSSTMRSSGARICQRLRRSAPETPLIHCRSADMKEPLDAAADVYLQKPFTSRKLSNRIRALLPANDSEEQIVRAGHLTLYLGKRSVEVGGKGEHQLTPKLTRLLEEFLRHPNEVLSRKQLMEQVWQTSYVGDTRTLDVHIRWAREIIEEQPKQPKLLATVRGIGYIFQSPNFHQGKKKKRQS